MKSIIKEINEWFLAKRDYFDSFALNDIRVESWFKAELLTLLELLKCGLVIDDFETETTLRASGAKRKIDFKVIVDQLPCLCQIRALRTNAANAIKSCFFDGPHALIKDCRKLDAVADDKHEKCLLVFAYPRPATGDWQDVLDEMNEDLEHWTCLTRLADYPPHAFIALWHC